MPVKSLRKPSYTLHKATGQARVRIDGRDHYLGSYGSPESRGEYDRLMVAWLSKQDVSRCRLTVGDLALLYLEHADGYYRKNGRPTSEPHNIRMALRPMLRLYWSVQAREFGPLKLKTVRDAMIQAGVVRSNINRHVGRIKRIFRWAVESEYLRAEVYTTLCAVPGLRRGRSGAKESAPVKSVPHAMIDAIEPYVTPQVWAMVQLQLLTGMRPGEVLAMRGCDLNTTGRIWEYIPQEHKGEHHDRHRIVFLGPRAQVIVREWLKADTTAYLFSPADAWEEHLARRRANRRTPMTPSQRVRKRKAAPAKRPGERYTVLSYRQAIAKACERAFGMPKELRKIPKDATDADREWIKREAANWRRQHCWHPHQLRHNAATLIRREAGIETARCVLGHASAAITEVYAEMDLAKAREIIGRVG